MKENPFEKSPKKSIAKKPKPISLVASAMKEKTLDEIQKQQRKERDLPEWVRKIGDACYDYYTMTIRPIDDEREELVRAEENDLNVQERIASNFMSFIKKNMNQLPERIQLQRYVRGTEERVCYLPRTNEISMGEGASDRREVVDTGRITTRHNYSPWLLSVHDIDYMLYNLSKDADISSEIKVEVEKTREDIEHAKMPWEKKQESFTKRSALLIRQKLFNLIDVIVKEKGSKLSADPQQVSSEYYSYDDPTPYFIYLYPKEKRLVMVPTIMNPEGILEADFSNVSRLHEANDKQWIKCGSLILRKVGESLPEDVWEGVEKYFQERDRLFRENELSTRTLNQ